MSTPKLAVIPLKSLSVPIRPFATPSPPPAPLVVLLDLTDFTEHSNHAVLLADEEFQGRVICLDPEGDSGKVTKIMPARLYHPYARQQSGSRSPSPETSISNNHTYKTRALARRTSTSPLTTPPSSVSSTPCPEDVHVSIRPTPVQKLKIERPKDAARKNLETLLQWESAVYKDFKMAISVACKEHLDANACFKDQDDRKLEQVRTGIAANFPVIDNYEALWPVDIAIQAFLKSSSALSKRKNTASAKTTA